MDNDTIKTIIMAITATIALATYIYNIRKNKVDKDKSTTNGDSNIIGSQVTLQGYKNSIDQRKTIINYSVPIIEPEQLETSNKRAEANHRLNLVLLPTIISTAVTIFLLGYLSFSLSWALPLTLVGYLILFNAIKGKFDGLLDNATVFVSKLKFLNTWTLARFNIDLENEQHFLRLKNLIMVLGFMLLCGLLAVGMFYLLISNPPSLFR